MKCEELLQHLNEYVDGTIAPEVCEQFEGHMIDCDPCQVVVDNIRKTIVLYKEGERYELPVEFKNRLRDTLREKWLEKHPQG
jgi:hypothetical protein